MNTGKVKWFNAEKGYGLSLTTTDRVISSFISLASTAAATSPWKKDRRFLTTLKTTKEAARHAQSTLPFFNQTNLL